jgi:hypothetical protein
MISSMKRDMDLVRQALIQVEERNHQPLSVEGFSTEDVLGHFDLLIDAGLLCRNLLFSHLKKR